MSIPLFLAVDTSGAPREWITWQEAVIYHTKNMVAWEHGVHNYTFTGGVSRLTGEKTKITIHSIIAIKGLEIGKAYKKLNKEPVVTNKLLFRRDRNICAYCGSEFYDSELTRDHVIPRRLGGKSTWTNLVTCCRGCNHRKADRTPQGAHMELLYVPYVPNRFEWLILSNRKILFDQMEFLRAGIPSHSRIL